jgi:hypothetical protein
MHMNKLHTFKSYIFLKHIQYLLTTTYVFKDLAFFHISGYKVHLLPVQQLLQAPQVKTCKYFQSQLSSPIGGFFFNKCPWHRRALEASNLRLCNTTTFSSRSFAESCYKIKRDASQRQWELQKDWNPMMTKWKTIWPHALQHLHKKRVKVGSLVGSREPELRQLCRPTWEMKTAQIVGFRSEDGCTGRDRPALCRERVALTPEWCSTLEYRHRPMYLATLVQPAYTSKPGCSSSHRRAPYSMRPRAVIPDPAQMGGTAPFLHTGYCNLADHTSHCHIALLLPRKLPVKDPNSSWLQTCAPFLPLACESWLAQHLSNRSSLKMLFLPVTCSCWYY